MSQKSIKLSSEFSKIVRETVQEEINLAPSETLKEYYLKCFNQAEIDGVPKTEISMVVRQKLNEEKTKQVLKKNPDASKEECLINPSWYTDCAREAGVTNPDMGRPTDDITDALCQNSSYIGQNARFINGVRSMKVLCGVLEVSFKTMKDSDGNLVNFEKMFSKKEVDNFLHEVDTVVEIAKNCANGKPKIPQNTHHLFKLFARVESGLLNTAKAFLQARLKLVTEHHDFITKKQASKFQNGTEPNALYIFIPKDRDTAIFMRWVGIQCAVCQSWRVKQATDASSNTNCVCVDCDTKVKAVTVSQCKTCDMLFYKDELMHIVKTKKCSNCNVDVTLPSELVAYANS